MKPLSLAEMIEFTGASTGAIFNKKIFEKKAREATEGEFIETIINGIVETTNTAKSGDFVLTGPAGEEYIISGEKFHKLYEKNSEGKYFTRPDKIQAVEVVEDKISFIAPWGSEMIAFKGDFIAYRSDSDAYRIEKDIFHQTYERAE